LTLNQGAPVQVIRRGVLTRRGLASPGAVLVKRVGLGESDEGVSSSSLKCGEAVKSVPKGGFDAGTILEGLVGRFGGYTWAERDSDGTPVGRQGFRPGGGKGS